MKYNTYMLSGTQNQAGNIKSKSADLRTEVRDQFESLNTVVSNLLGQINELTTESMRMANAARDLVDEGLDLVDDGEQ